MAARVFFNGCFCSTCRKKDICPHYKVISHEQRDVINHLGVVPDDIKMIMWVIECPYRVTNDEYNNCVDGDGNSKVCEVKADGKQTN